MYRVSEQWTAVRGRVGGRSPEGRLLSAGPARDATVAPRAWDAGPAESRGKLFLNPIPPPSIARFPDEPSGGGGPCCAARAG